MSSPADFPFIVSNGPGKIKDSAVRKLIRKQAMKDVGLTRRRRNQLSRNLACDTPTADSPEISESSISTASRTPSSSEDCSERDVSPATTVSEGTFQAWDLVTTDANDNPEWHLELSPQLYRSCMQAYENTRSKYNLDLTQLSFLTGFNISKGAMPAIAADPKQLISLLQHRQWSYLDYIPQLYSSSECVAAATDCLLAKVATLIAPSSNGIDVLRLYARAVRALQKAVTDFGDHTSSEVLCAVQLMAIFELLDIDKGAAFSKHISGAIQLMKHRNTRRLNTDFEKALFAGHVGPVVSEALVNNTPCYLEAPEWTSLYASMAQDSSNLTDRSPLVIEVRTLTMRVPSLWRDVDTAMKGDILFNNEVMTDLAERCQTLYSEYAAWLEKYKSHCMNASLTIPHSTEFSVRREILGIAYECIIIVLRLWEAVSDPDRIRLEQETQNTASLLLSMQEQSACGHSWLFSGHEVGIAQSIFATKDDWEEDLNHQTAFEVSIAARRRYCSWEGALRGG